MHSLSQTTWKDITAGNRINYKRNEKDIMWKNHKRNKVGFNWTRWLWLQDAYLESEIEFPILVPWEENKLDNSKISDSKRRMCRNVNGNVGNFLNTVKLDKYMNSPVSGIQNFAKFIDLK